MYTYTYTHIHTYTYKTTIEENVAMNQKESISDGFVGEKGRSKCYNYIIISKIKKKYILKIKKEKPTLKNKSRSNSFIFFFPSYILDLHHSRLEDNFQACGIPFQENKQNESTGFTAFESSCGGLTHTNHWGDIWKQLGTRRGRNCQTSDLAESTEAPSDLLFSAPSSHHP